jgi:hypothetical protein
MGNSGAVKGCKWCQNCQKLAKNRHKTGEKWRKTGEKG